MTTNKFINKHSKELHKLCKIHDVSRLYAFGSVLSNHFDDESSDIDLIVELVPMPPLQKGENLLSLWDKLESLFGRKVDLLTDKPIKNPYLQNSIDKSKQLIYDRRSQKVPV